MVAPCTSHGTGGRNRFRAYTAGGNSICYQTLLSGNNHKRAKTVTTQPLSCFRSILRRSPQDKIARTKPTSQVDPDNVGTKAPQREELDLHPIQSRFHPIVFITFGTNYHDLYLCCNENLFESPWPPAWSWWSKRLSEFPPSPWLRELRSHPCPHPHCPPE